MMKNKFINFIFIMKKTCFVLTIFICFIFSSCASNDDDLNGLNSQLEIVAELSESVKETSGLALINGFLVTHNDRGHGPILYTLDNTSGSIVNTINVNTSFSVDWEDLAQSETHLFIGEFGNNDGSRVDLKILKIDKQDFDPENSSSLAVDEIIFFNYPEQSNFTPNDNHNFDCEAFLYFEEYLYLFTKNRANKKTYLYKLPSTQGNYAATLIDSFEVGAKVTAADISPDKSTICLTAFKKKKDVYLWFFDYFQGDDFFNGNSQKHNLGAFTQVGQVEAVKFISNSELYLTNEKISTVQSRLYKFIR